MDKGALAATVLKNQPSEKQQHLKLSFSFEEHQLVIDEYLSGREVSWQSSAVG